MNDVKEILKNYKPQKDYLRDYLKENNFIGLSNSRASLRNYSPKFSRNWPKKYLRKGDLFLSNYNCGSGCELKNLMHCGLSLDDLRSEIGKCKPRKK